jgi:hypothetical protein
MIGMQAEVWPLMRGQPRGFWRNSGLVELIHGLLLRGLLHSKLLNLRAGKYRSGWTVDSLCKAGVMLTKVGTAGTCCCKPLATCFLEPATWPRETSGL